MADFKLEDYVDVAERLRLFYDRYPDGRISRLDDPRVQEVGDRAFVVYSSVAYRAPDDPTPCVGTAWEAFPGRTPYTRDSELMNAETAAWGRAIVAAGIPSKRIASANEVANREDADHPHGPPFSGTWQRVLDAADALVPGKGGALLDKLQADCGGYLPRAVGRALQLAHSYTREGGPDDE